MIFIILEKYMIENTHVKIYDDYIVHDIDVQKKYINNIIVNFIKQLSKNEK